MSNEDFSPPRLLRNRHVQSVLNSVGPRQWRAEGLRRQLNSRTRHHTLDCGAGVRLEGYYTPAADQERGLVILLHGWEGSSDSVYMLSSAKALLDARFSVFRLNFRDHGDTHHLNQEIFHSCRLDEVVGATREIAAQFPERPLMIAGFSLGGNFALRVARELQDSNIVLNYAFAVCPVISPARTLEAMENGGGFYQRHFLKKWGRSLKRKRALFPDQFDHIVDLIPGATIRSMTRALVEEHSEFPTLDDYLDGYAIGGDRLASLAIPATILAAADDPINPIDDFNELQLNENTELIITRYGGHCGYAENFRMENWSERYLTERLTMAADKFQPSHQTN